MVIQEDKRKSAMESPAQKQVEGFMLEHRRDSMRARSFISSAQKENAASSKYEMSNGKKLDDEISKIQSKIQQFEEEKRKLNIEFKPFAYSHNTRSSADLTKRSSTTDKSKIYERRFQADCKVEK